MKLFTYNQANNSLVYVRALVENACYLRGEMKRMQENKEDQREIRKVAREIMKEMKNIEDVGCRFLSFDTGLVAFPWQEVGARLIYWYWSVSSNKFFLLNEDIKFLKDKYTHEA